MRFHVRDALSFIESARALLQEEPVCLASSEDAAYFRAHLSRTKEKSARNEVLPKPPAPILSAQESSSSPLKKIPPKEIPKESALLLPPKLSTPSQEAAPLEKSSERAAPKELGAQYRSEDSLSSQDGVLQTPTPLSKNSSRPPSQFRALLQKIAPNLAILDSIPDDSAAKQIANRWKTKNQSAPISILSSGELPQHKVLLSEIATALDVYFGPAKLIEADGIEKEKEWKTFLSVGTLKLIVVCDSTLWQLQNLRQCYKETPTTGVRMLGEVPLFLLPDLSLYLKDPLLKRSLWKALCSKLS